MKTDTENRISDSERLKRKKTCTINLKRGYISDINTHMHIP